MDSTPVNAACDTLLMSIASTCRALSYPSVPVTDYFRSKDIKLLQAELNELTPVLHQLRSRHLSFPEEIEDQLVAILLDCNDTRHKSHTLLDRDHGTHPIAAKAKNHRTSWLCMNRDEAFLLRHQLVQQRSVLEATLAVANLMSLGQVVATAIFSRRAVKDIGSEVVVLREAVGRVLGEAESEFDRFDGQGKDSRGWRAGILGQRADGRAYLRRSLIGTRAMLHVHRDCGSITATRVEIIMFLDRLLALAIKAA